MKILIVEDNPQEAKNIRNMLEKSSYQVHGVADSLHMALNKMHETPPDLLIIDIMLNGREEGITLAKTVQQQFQGGLPFVFLTSLTDRHTFEQAKLTAPYAYLVKPVNEFALQYSLELALERYSGANGMLSAGKAALLRQQECLYVKRGNSLVKVPLRDILFLEVDGKYCSIVTRDTKLLVFQALTDMMEILPDLYFFRVHRNFVVNLQEIKEVNIIDNYLTLNNGHLIDMSRRYKEQLLKNMHTIR